MSTANPPAVPSVKNRRRSRRKRPRSTAQVECFRGSLGLGANLALQLLDISECGVGLVVKEALKSEEEVQIVVRDFGQKKSIKRQGNVCWCLPLQDGRFCAGVRFEKWLRYADVEHVSRPS